MVLKIIISLRYWNILNLIRFNNIGLNWNARPQVSRRMYFTFCTLSIFNFYNSPFIPRPHARFNSFPPRTYHKGTLDDDMHASLDREFSILWIRGLRHPIPQAAFPVPYFRLPRRTLHHPPAIYCSTGASILLRRCICREHAHAEASESRYIRLRARAWQAQARRTESRYYERRIRVSAARPLVDQPIYRCSCARRAGERRPKLADRVAASGELMGRPRSVVRERD